MINKNTYASMLLTLMLAITTFPAVVQSDGVVSGLSDSEVVVLEGLPEHLVARIDDAASDLPKDVFESVIVAGRMWDPEDFPLKVCFFGGSDSLRVLIVQVARRWMQQDNRIAFDFGSDSNSPRSCKGNRDDIRIGFALSGYWSLVGKDSRKFANTTKVSMNFGSWDVELPKTMELEQTVLHEFGHSLGLAHEHQHPFSDCEAEFNWAKIYDYLKEPPNRWSKETVDRNMRRLLPENVQVMNFDPKSVMRYSFPPFFYNSGPNSKCFTSRNYTLSNGDLKAVASIYPTDTIAAHTAVAERRYMALRILSKMGLPDRDKAFQAFIKWPAQDKQLIPEAVGVAPDKEN